MRPDVLAHDADSLVVQDWLRRFKSWYDSSKFSSATLAVQHDYLRSVLDATLNDYLETNITSETLIYGTTLDAGCIEILQAEFNRKNPVFNSRDQYYTYAQSHGQPFTEYIARVHRLSRLAPLSDMSEEDHLVHKIIRDSLPDDMTRGSYSSTLRLVSRLHT